MSGFTDIHQHVIYGVDDGPLSCDEMAAMLRASVEDGVSAVMATPHMQPGVKPFDPDRYYARLDEARKACKDLGLPLQIYQGAEVMVTSHCTRYLKDQRIPTLADGRCVLVEFLPSVSESQLKRGLDGIRQCGYYPVLAHVERYPVLIKKPDLAHKVRDVFGVSYQMNAATLLDVSGFFMKRAIKRFLDADLIDYIATDAHNTTTRPTQMTRAYLKLVAEYGEAFAKRLTGLGGSDILMLKGLPT